MSIMTSPSFVELSMEDLEQIVAQAKGALSEELGQKLEALVGSYLYLSDTIQNRKMSMRELRALLLGKSSEKSNKVLPNKPKDDDEESKDDDKKPNKKKPKGHGRNGAGNYPGAKSVDVPHGTLQPGDACPICTKGTVYEKKPVVLVRLSGQAPVCATVYKCQRLRCGLCNATFKAEPPPDVGNEKYDARSAAMIALLKYGSGLPFYRLERLQGNLGIPLPASTQWDLAQKTATKLAPILDQMIDFAANAHVVHNDDTSARILDLQGKPPTDEDGIDKNRTGIHTTGIVAKKDDHQVALFFTGRLHAGENLQQVLAQRTETNPPIQMSDALSHNVPKDFETILANCTAHGRRYFVKQIENFPDECRRVIEALGEVYRIDAEARQENLSPEQRLALHQRHSQPIMDELETWLTDQLEQNKAEPNSNLGKAIRYMLKHWSKLTLFLRVAGAPLDNNICERALKKAILHRRNSLFYKTENGARVGDLFLSIIHTAELAKVDPFDYLTQLIANHDKLAEQPGAWMPWNYREQLGD